MREESRAAVDLALARGVMYEALALSFTQPAAGVERLRTADGRQAVTASAALLDDAAPDAAPLAPLADRLLVLLGAAGRDDLAAGHHRIFGHTARGDVSPCATEYGVEGAFHQPHQLADIAGYYRAFGLAVKPGSGERVDHVACLCEFLAVLCRKEAGQCEEDLDPAAEDVAITRDALRRFLRDHLAWFGRAFGRRVVAADEGGPYGAAGALLVRWLERECDRVGVKHGPAVLPLRPLEFDPTPMACGTGDELIQIRRRDELPPCEPR